MPPRADRPVFALSITPEPHDIDQLGHVNNAAYVRWIERVSTAHWHAVARPQDVEHYLWVIVRHEIDYRRPTAPHETLTAETWVGEPQGARFDRHVRFLGPEGGPRVEARTIWALVDRATLRPLRVPAELALPFIS